MAVDVNKLSEIVIEATGRINNKHIVYEVVDYLYLNNYLALDNYLTEPNPIDKLVNGFANKVATAMKEIGSSHVYFILQEAFGEDLDWTEAEKILKEVIEFTKKGKDE